MYIAGAGANLQNESGIFFDNYEMAHFRLLSDATFYLMVDHILNQLENI